MPTIVRLDGLRVAIYPNDHRPPHVHVIGRSGEAVFVLNCPDGPVVLRESQGFPLAEIRQTARGLLGDLPLLCAEWRRLHGDI